MIIWSLFCLPLNSKLCTWHLNSSPYFWLCVCMHACRRRTICRVILQHWPRGLAGISRVSVWKGRREKEKTPGSGEKPRRDGTTREMLQEPDLAQASETESSAREEGREGCRCHCPRRVFQTIQSGAGNGLREKLDFLGKGDEKEEGHQKPSSFSGFWPSKWKRWALHELRQIRCSAQSGRYWVFNSVKSVIYSMHCMIGNFRSLWLTFWWYLEKYINCLNFCQCKSILILLVH